MKILTELQRSVLKALFDIEEIRTHFYLTGGTALSAYYLNHRYSDDLDLFTHDIDLDSIEPIVIDTLNSAKFKINKTRSSATFRRFQINGTLQLDLVHDVEHRVGAPILKDGIMIDTEKNIAVNKVLAIYGRFDPKDYVDLYFLFKNGKLNILELIMLGQQKDAGLEAFQWAKVLQDADAISILPKMIVDCKLPELKDFFKDLRNKVIDSIKPGG